MVADVKKDLGRFDTPLPLAIALVRWAVTGDDPRVIDPCFGGCVFLKAIVARLQELGLHNLAGRVFGTDIDEGAHDALEANGFGGALHLGRMDFLTTTLATFGVDGFSAVVGNPPYVRYHNLDLELRAVAAEIPGRLGVDLPRSASYWAYFVLHGATLLRPGGSLAFVLPGAFLHSDYSSAIHQYLRLSFERIIVAALDERLFPEADESTVLLLASGYGRRHRSYEFYRLHSLTDVENWLVRGDAPRCTRSDLKPSFWQLYECLKTHPEVVRLTDLVKLRIGVVTGANDVFVVSNESLDSLRLTSEDVIPIVASSRFLRGIEFTRADHQALVRDGSRCWLLAGHGCTDKSLSEHWAAAEERGIHKRHHCSIRNPWHAITDVESPLAFLEYMGGDTPRIVRNTAGATATNAIHRLYSLDGESHMDWLKLSLASLTSLFRASAEVEGRSYGGGVLKLEPSEARRLIVPFPDTRGLDLREVFGYADRACREGKLSVATDSADKVLLQEPMGLTRGEIKELRDAIDILRRQRKGRRPPRSSKHDCG